MWIRRFRDSDTWLLVETFLLFLGLLIAIPTVYVFWVDLHDRKINRISQAWSLVTQSAPGNSGKGPALEYLNENGIALIGIDLSPRGDQAEGTHLYGVNLRDAELGRSSLRYVNLNGATLIGSNLVGVDLENASLMSANLRNADLAQARLVKTNFHFTNLSYVLFFESNLEGANFREAILDGTQFINVDLTTVNNLTQSQLLTACGQNINLPEGMTIKPC